MLDEQVKDKLAKHYEQLNSEGKLPSRQQYEQFYENFRRRFGPEQLRKLEGERLLETMHGGKSSDSMAYWLEFKNETTSS